MWEDLGHCGWVHPRQVVLGYISKQAEKVMKNKTVSVAPPQLMLWSLPPDSHLELLHQPLFLMGCSCKMKYTFLPLGRGASQQWRAKLDRNWYQRVVYCCDKTEHVVLGKTVGAI